MVVGWAAGAPLLASHTGGLLYRAPLSACGWLTPSKPNSRGGHVLGGIREGSGEPSQTKKRHMALLFGYQGTGYFGLQSQRAEGTPGQPTISDVLRQGLLHSGAILHTNFSPLTRTKWSLASRTDKGVHAARASVSFKMETLDSQVEPFGVGECDDGGVGQRMQLTVEALEAINAHLPPEVQLFGGATVRKSFDSRECASSRTYEYLLPRSMLDGMTVSEFDAVMREFEGSQKVHNFCSGLRRQAGQWEYDGESWPLALDPRPRQSVAYRSVMRCGVRRTLTVKGEDYLVLEISGVSFMLHQIRHMVGTGLAIAHGLVPHDILPLALRSPLEINISPLAPATGLLLDEVRWFNMAKGEYELQFSPEAHACAERFKENMLYPHIHERLQAENSMVRFTNHMHEQFCGSRQYTLEDYDKLRRINANLFESTARQREGRQASMRGKELVSEESSSADDVTTTKAAVAGMVVEIDDNYHKRENKERKNELPGGLFVQICVHFGLLPGDRSFAMLRQLRNAFDEGLIESKQPYEYYLNFLEKTHGPPPPRPIVAIQQEKADLSEDRA